jgi:phosphate transport system protein
MAQQKKFLPIQKMNARKIILPEGLVDEIKLIEHKHEIAEISFTRIIETKSKNKNNMTHLDTELKLLRAEINEMWMLVITQMNKAKVALIDFDKDTATDVDINEKRVNVYELKIDRDCENILALYNPVAIDLRFVLAVLKINYNLERIGDYAQGIALMIKDMEKPFQKNLFDKTGVIEMYEECIVMLCDTLQAFEKENNQLARTIFGRDEKLDAINRKANTTIGEYIKMNPNEIEHGLNILSVVRKLERVGDQTKNIAEEIIFYIEAKVLKHRTKSILKSGDTK